MSTSEIQNWLRESVVAIKAGESAKARELLMRVLKEDDRNEQAWLWLSGAAETDEERRICLENALTINPKNNVARTGLIKLGVTPPSPSETNEESENNPSRKKYMVRRERPAVSLASAVLYPDKQVQEWSWEEPEVAIQRRGYDTEVKAQSKFDDVWTSEADLCAFCAYELDFQDETCPQCQQYLIHKAFRYEKPSRNMYVLFVFILAQAQLFLAQAIYEIVQRDSLISSYVILPTLFAVVFFVAAVGIYQRRVWAYYTALALTIFILVAVVTSIIVPVDLTALQLPVRDPAVESLLDSFGNLISTMIRLFQIALALLAFLYVLWVAPDFVRDEKRLTAVLSKGLRLPSDYNVKAREFSKKGMWATAVLHWQHAAGKEPHSITYQRHLGLAYAQLGFYERSLDILQSAFNLSTHPAKQQELQKLIQTVEKMQRDPRTSS